MIYIYINAGVKQECFYNSFRITVSVAPMRLSAVARIIFRSLKNLNTR